MEAKLEGVLVSAHSQSGIAELGSLYSLHFERQAFVNLMATELSCQCTV